MSTVSESKPWCAMPSAVKAVGIDSHPLTGVSPRFHIVLRRFSRTVLSLRADTPGPLYRTSVALVLRRAARGPAVRAVLRRAHGGRPRPRERGAGGARGPQGPRRADDARAVAAGDARSAERAQRPRLRSRLHVGDGPRPHGGHRALRARGGDLLGSGSQGVGGALAADAARRPRAGPAAELGRRARRRARRPARTPGARALARRDPRRAVALRHRPRVHEVARRLLARPLRLARAGGGAQRAPPVHRGAGRHRPALHPRARGGTTPDAAAALARLAGLDRRIPAAGPDADRSGALRRRSG